MRRPAIITGCVLSALLFGAGIAALADSASAAWYPVFENGAPGDLVILTEMPLDELIRVDSEQPTFWRVSAHLDGQQEGELTIGLRKTGKLATLPEGLRVSIDSCAEEWSTSAVEPTCAAGGVSVLAVTPADDATADGSEWDLGRLAASAPVHLLVTLRLADELTDPEIDTARGELALRLTAASIAEPQTDPAGGSAPTPALALGGSGDPLAETGVDAIAFVVAALGLIGIGIFGARLRRGAPR